MVELIQEGLGTSQQALGTPPRAGGSGHPATLSRDLRELGAVKGPDGYPRPASADPLVRGLRQWLRTATPAQNLVVLRTLAGRRPSASSSTPTARRRSSGPSQGTTRSWSSRPRAPPRRSSPSTSAGTRGEGTGDGRPRDRRHRLRRGRGERSARPPPGRGGGHPHVRARGRRAAPPRRPRRYEILPRSDLVSGHGGVVFSCLPHGIGAPIVRAALDGGATVIDLSGDPRFDDAAAFEAAYGTAHLAPELCDAACYGPPSTMCSSGGASDRQPGCYPTASFWGSCPHERRLLASRSRIVRTRRAVSPAPGNRPPRRPSTGTSTRAARPTASAPTATRRRSPRASPAASRAR